MCNAGCEVGFTFIFDIHPGTRIAEPLQVFLIDSCLVGQCEKIASAGIFNDSEPVFLDHYNSALQFPF